MKRKLITVVIILAAALAVVSLGKNILVKTVVESGVGMVTGLRMNIRSFDLGIVNTVVRIKDMKLFNPKGFPDKVMLDMPEVYVDYDLPALIRGRIHLREAGINVKEFMVVKNADGKLNLDSLKVVRAEKETEKPAAKGKAFEMRIDDLHLVIGKVVYKDYSKGGKPSVREFNIDLNEKYSNVDHPAQLVSLVVVKALTNTTIAKLTGFDLKELRGNIGSIMDTAEKIIGPVGEGMGEAVTKTAQQAEEAVKAATGTLKETAKELTDVIKLPFGGEK